MGAYNVLNRASLAAGLPEDVSQVLANFDAIAAILNGGIDNSNLTAGILASKLAGYPTDATKALFGDGTWKAPPAPVSYRKNTAKSVFNSAANVDLLNGEITIAAGAMGATSVLRGRFFGTHKQATAGPQASPRFQVAVGGTVILDTAALAAAETANVNVWGWDMTVEFINLGATNAQIVRLLLNLDQQYNAAAASLFATGIGLFENGASYGGYGHFVAKGYNTSAIDMTVARLLELKVTNPLADPAYDVTLKAALVEII